MICQNTSCAKIVPIDANFCPACATPVDDSYSQSVFNTGNAGGDIKQYQAGRDLIFYPQAGLSRTDGVPEYHRKWSWKSPLTLAALNWISVVLGVLSLGSVYKVLEPFVDGLLRGAGLDAAVSTQPFWVYVLLALVLLFVIALILRRIASNETQHFSRFSLLPAITGWGCKIGIARFEGRCVCGGKLRFYSKAVGFSSPDPQSGKQKVTDREMTAECVRDPKHHTWRVESTDRHDGMK